MLFVVFALLAAQGNGPPEPLITDLVGRSAEWHGQVQPNFHFDVKAGSNEIPAFPRWLPGGMTRLEFQVHLAAPTAFVAEIDRANAPAEAQLLVDGSLVSRLPITVSTFKGPSEQKPEGPLGAVDSVVWTTVPAGDHTVTCWNAGHGWIEVSAIRIAGIGPKQFHMDRQLVGTFRVQEESLMEAPNLTMDWWGVGFGAVPKDEDQELVEINARAIDDEYWVADTTDQTGQRVMLLRAAGAPNHPNSLAVHIDMTVKLFKRSLKWGAPATPPQLSATDRSRYLGLPNNADMNVLADWMKGHGLNGKGNDTDLEFAQKLVNLIRRSLRYKWDARAPQGHAPTISRGWGACGDLNGLAVDALKLAGIPARTRAGVNIVGAEHPFAPSGDGDMHVGAEFWAQGVGWVPIEASAFDGPSLNEGGPLRPFIGTTTGEHLTKHYDVLWIDNQSRVLQLMDFPFGQWHGAWDGWKVHTKLGYSKIALPAKPGQAKGD